MANNTRIVFNFTDGISLCNGLKEKLITFKKEYKSNKNKEGYNYSGLKEINKFTIENIDNYIDLYEKLKASKLLLNLKFGGGMFFKNKKDIQPIVKDIIKNINKHIEKENAIIKIKKEINRLNTIKYNSKDAIIYNLYELVIIIRDFLLNNCNNILLELYKLNNEIYIKRKYIDEYGVYAINNSINRIIKISKEKKAIPAVINITKMRLAQNVEFEKSNNIANILSRPLFPKIYSKSSSNSKSSSRSKSTSLNKSTSLRKSSSISKK